MKNDNQTEPPSWTFAVQLYLAVLNNPDAPTTSKIEARGQILRLAHMVDNMNQAALTTKP